MKTLFTAIALTIAALTIGCSSSKDEEKPISTPTDPADPTPNPDPTPSGPATYDVLPEEKIDADALGTFVKSTFSNSKRENISSTNIFTIDNSTFIPTASGGTYKQMTDRVEDCGEYRTNDFPFSEYLLNNPKLSFIQYPYQPPIHSDVVGKQYRRLDGRHIIYDDYKPGKSLVLTMPHYWFMNGSGKSQGWQNEAFNKMFAPEEIDANASKGTFVGMTGGTKYYSDINNNEEHLTSDYKFRTYWFFKGGDFVATGAESKTVKTVLKQIHHAILLRGVIIFTGTKNGSDLYWGKVNAENPSISDNTIRKISDKELIGGGQFSLLDNGMFLGASFIFDPAEHQIGFFKEAPIVKDGVKTAEYGIRKLFSGIHIMIEKSRDGIVNAAQDGIYYFIPKAFIHVYDDSEKTTGTSILVADGYNHEVNYLGHEQKFVLHADDYIKTSNSQDVEVVLKGGDINNFFYEVKRIQTDRPAFRQVLFGTNDLTTSVEMWINAERR